MPTLALGGGVPPATPRYSAPIRNTIALEVTQPNGFAVASVAAAAPPKERRIRRS